MNHKVFLSFFEDFHSDSVVVVLSNSFATPWAVAPRLLCPWGFPGKTTGVGCHFLLQGIFMTQRLNLHLLHWQRGLYHWDHRGSPIVRVLIYISSDSARVPFCTSSQPLWFVFLMTAILTYVRWCLIVVIRLICMALMSGDAKHPFIYLLSICVSCFNFFEKYLFRVLCPFLNCYFFSLLLSYVYVESHIYWVTYMSYIYILYINPLSDIWFENIFPIPQGNFLHCWLFPLLCRSTLILMQFYLSIFTIVAYAFCVISKKLLVQISVKNHFS